MLRSKRKRYSLYHDRRRSWLSFSLVRLLLLLFVAYQLFTLLVAQTVRVDSSSMEPAFAAGDRLVVSAVGYGSRLPLLGVSAPTLRAPQRGDAVIVASPLSRRPGLFVRTVAPVIRFATGNRIDLQSVAGSGWDNPITVKRIVALPGDTVELRGGVAYVTPPGGTTVNEHALAGRRYTLETADQLSVLSELSAQVGQAARTGHAVFADTDPLTLNAGQYFILGDNRALSVDSRHYGPVEREALRYRVLLRFWPLRRFGVP